MCRFTIRAHGYEVVGPNGNKLLLPYTHGNDQKGYYWSGNKGYVLEFQPGYKEINQDDDAELVENFATYCGLSIRAVKKSRINIKHSNQVRTKNVVNKSNSKRIAL